MGQYMEAALARERYGASPGMHSHEPSSQSPPILPTAVVLGEGLGLPLPHPTHCKDTGTGLPSIPTL